MTETPEIAFGALVAVLVVVLLVVEASLPDGRVRTFIRFLMLISTPVAIALALLYLQI